MSTTAVNLLVGATIGVGAVILFPERPFIAMLYGGVSGILWSLADTACAAIRARK